ncbi:MAG: hypothetical protein ONB24_08090 [candidate division KSB1 bacterium]|nr:hypothetical protein [candidate division KSB1 bacterium]
MLTMPCTKSLELEWTVGPHWQLEEPPTEQMPAQVPSAVQLDYAAAKGWPPYWFGDNFKDYRWMEDVFWTYRCRFPKPNFHRGERVYFYSKGIDYQFFIRLNGAILLEQEGMFTPVCLDLTDYLRADNELLVTIFPAPKSRPEPADRTQADQCVKPAVSYGWDWHPRLIPLGIWDETGILVCHPAVWAEPSIDYELDEELTEAAITLTFEKELLPLEFVWKLEDPEGKLLFSRTGRVKKGLHLKETSSFIELWWPHDQGMPRLYTSNVSFYEGGRLVADHRRRIGFRRIRLVMNEGAWDEPAAFPKTRSVPPMQLEVNGRRIFAKGSNWVPPEIFPGLLTRERYERLIDLAVNANMNLLRLWGGGVINKECFFDLCDEKGILLWQDFPLACNNYPSTPAYLKILEQEARSIITRLKPHPSLAIWCGGNELFNSWSGMTDQSLALRLLNSLCLQLDPQRPFLPTSPLMGVGHGHYRFRDPESGEEVFQIIRRSRCTAYTEFGIPSPSSVEVLRSFLPAEEVWPPKAGTAWESHHGFNAWEKDTWLTLPTLEHYFGSVRSLEELVERGQMLQAEGYKCLFEGARRQKPYCAMALNWCFNEPWPTAANNSIIQWPAQPKPAYYAVQAACRTILFSAEFPKFVWQAGEELEFRLWLLNDSFESVPPASVSVFLSEEQEIANWDCPGAPRNCNFCGPLVKYRLTKDNFPERLLRISLKCRSNPHWNSEYFLLLSAH